jgi:hypothetical protein
LMRCVVFVIAQNFYNNGQPEVKSLDTITKNVQTVIGRAVWTGTVDGTIADIDKWLGRVLQRKEGRTVARRRSYNKLHQRMRTAQLKTQLSSLGDLLGRVMPLDRLGNKANVACFSTPMRGGKVQVHEQTPMHEHSMSEHEYEHGHEHE